MSEKPMTELLKRSGIIDKHIAEFKKWRIIGEEGELKSTEMMVEDLAQDIAKLLEEEPVMKQTMVTPIRTSPPEIWYGERDTFSANKDQMGRLVVGPDVELFRGDLIWCETDPDTEYAIVEVEKLFEGDAIVAYLVTIVKE